MANRKSFEPGEAIALSEEHLAAEKFSEAFLKYDHLSKAMVIAL